MEEWKLIEIIVSNGSHSMLDRIFMVTTVLSLGMESGFLLNQMEDLKSIETICIAGRHLEQSD